VILGPGTYPDDGNTPKEIIDYVSRAYINASREGI